MYVLLHVSGSPVGHKQSIPTNDSMYSVRVKICKKHDVDGGYLTESNPEIQNLALRFAW